MYSARTSPLTRANAAYFLFVFLCITFLSPWLQRTIGNYAIVAIIGFYLLLESNHLCNISDSEKTIATLIFCYIGMLLLYTFLKISDKGAGQASGVRFMLTYLLIVPIYNRLNKRQCFHIIILCIMAILVTLWQNYSVWKRMGNRMTQQFYKTEGLLEVANTQYVSAIVLASGVLFAAFLYCKNKVYRYLCLALSILIFLFNMTVTQRAAAMLLSIVMFAFLYFGNGKSAVDNCIRGILFVIGGVILAIFHKFFLMTLAGLINSQRITARINAMTRLIESQDITQYGGGSLTARIHLALISIHTFFSSPWNFLFGVGDKANNLQVGNHSYFFDEFAKFGLLGGLLSISIIGGMIFTAIKISTIKSNERLYGLIVAFYIIVVIRAVTGGILAPPIGVVMNVFAPLAFKLMKYEESPMSPKAISVACFQP